MPAITSDFSGQTVITTFECSPATAEDLLEALRAAYDEVIRHQPGYISAALHINDARTRICTYSQWRARSDYQAMLREPEMRVRNREMMQNFRSFEPVMYDLDRVF